MLLSPRSAVSWLLVLASSFWFAALITAAPSTFLSGDSLGTVPLGAQSLVADDNPDAIIKSLAISTLLEILRVHWGATGNEDIQATPHPVFVDKNGDMHIRAKQYLSGGLPIRGASIMIHLHPDGTVFAVNGEFTQEDLIDISEPKMDCQAAVMVAMKQAEILNGTYTSDCKLVAVQGKDGLAHVAFERVVGWQPLADPYQQATVFASIVNGDLLALHLNTPGARALQTYDCQFTGGRLCAVKSDSRDPIATENAAVNDAHNYAIMAYDFFLEHFERDSLDGKGLTITSYVDVGKDNINAVWVPFGENYVVYGGGDGVTFTYLSRALDLVGHELYHGVNAFESALIFFDESGAISEALGDIMGAVIERVKGGKAEDMVWEFGEDVWLSTNFTEGFRNMADPQKYKDYDFYFDRYRGTEDRGGIHLNNGIMNLAFVLMVKGGYHPRGKTYIQVPPIDDVFDESLLTAAKILYNADRGCLTESSTFRAARQCTIMSAGAFGAEKSVAAAWDAVGVRKIVTINDNVPVTNQALYEGGVEEYMLRNVKGGYTLTCTITGIDGDPDLYVRFGDHPEPFPFLTQNDCADAIGRGPSGATCTVYAPHLQNAMHAYVMIKAAKEYTNLTLKCFTRKVCQIPGSTCKARGDCCRSKKSACDGPDGKNQRKICKKCRGLNRKCRRTSECCHKLSCQNKRCSKLKG